MNPRRQRMFDPSIRFDLGRYRLLVASLSPYLIGYTAWRAWKEGGWRYFAQRMGFAYPKPRGGRRPLWLHCASVGELNAAWPLIELLRERCAEVPLLITTNTPTARARLAGRESDDLRHAYLPLDLPAPVALFLRRTAPRCGLILETELWASLYNACACWEVPLVIVNGRLSARTLGANAWLKAGYRICMGAVRAVLARSAADAAGFRELGATEAQVEVLGSIKFAAPAAVPGPVEGVPPGPYLLAASTHEDEELRLARLWRELDVPGWQLVVAPRHPDRGERIAGRLREAGFAVARRSLGDAPAAGAVYLADTLGELPGLIAGADLVFMGGSLVPRGGQNLLEPARLGRAVVCGPHMENFALELAELAAAQAVVQVAGEAQLAEALGPLMREPARRERLAAAASAAVTRHGDVAERYLSRIRALCDL